MRCFINSFTSSPRTIAEDKCKYASFYTTPEGTIVLEICADQCVQVTYEDAINKAIHAKEKEASVSEDI